MINPILKLLGVATLSPAVLLLGCVSTKTFDATLNELQTTRQRNEAIQQDLTKVREELNATRQTLNQANLKLDDASKELIDLEVHKQDLQTKARNLNTQLAMAKKVADETRRRNEIYARFIQRLQHRIDAGQLSVKIESGRIVIQLPDNVLFHSGRAELNSEGKEALRQIATVLAQFNDRHFQIEGHTDNQPIRSPRYPSNWELSAARALAVVHLLIDAGVPPPNLSAAGFGEYQPRALNSDAAGRQLNRRIEIVMLPNLDILSNEIPNIEVKNNRPEIH
jgi:chemotaxis protein MotB